MSGMNIDNLGAGSMGGIQGSTGNISADYIEKLSGGEFGDDGLEGSTNNKFEVKDLMNPKESMKNKIESQAKAMGQNKPNPFLTDQ